MKLLIDIPLFLLGLTIIGYETCKAAYERRAKRKDPHVE